MILNLSSFVSLRLVDDCFWISRSKVKIIVTLLKLVSERSLRKTTNVKLVLILCNFTLICPGQYMMPIDFRVNR